MDKENCCVARAPTGAAAMEKQPAPKKAAKKLSAKWLFDAAMLSSPIAGPCRPR